MSDPKSSRLNSLPWYVQLAIFGGLAVVLFALFWYMVTSPIREEAKGIREQVNVLRAKNEQARIALQRINEFRAAYQSKVEEYNELKALLPEQREITNVLQDLQDRARTNKLVLRRFSPKEDSQAQEGISAKPVEVEVSSTFTNLREFYEQLARLQRIVSVTDFSINQAPSQTENKSIEARFVLTAYFASPENLNPPAPTKPGAPGAPVAPGTTTPAAPPAAN